MTTKPIYLLSILCFALGCGPARLVPSREAECIRAVVEREVVRDTVVVVEADSSLMSALVECDSTGRARLKEIEQLRSSERINTSIAMDNNRLNVKSVVDSMGIYLTLKDRYREETAVKTVTETITEIKEVNVLRWYQEALIWVGAIALILIIIYSVCILAGNHLNTIYKLIKHQSNNG